MRQNDGMQLLPENLPFYCCSMCLVVFKTYREFEAHVCKNGGSSVDGETTMVSSLHTDCHDNLKSKYSTGVFEPLSPNSKEPGLNKLQFDSPPPPRLPQLKTSTVKHS